MKLKLALTLFVLVSCGSNEKQQEKINYHSYDEVKEKFIDWNDSLSKDNHYFVYYFSVTCKYCEEIRNEVVQIALKNEKAIYFCNQNVVTQDMDPSSTIGQKEIKYLFVRGFPSLVEIEDKTVKNNMVGKTQVINYLRS